MSFNDYSEQYNKARSQWEGVQQIGERRWLLRPGKSRDEAASWNSYTDAQLTIRVRVTPRGGNFDQNVAIFVEREGYGMMDHCLGELSPTEIRRIAETKEIVQEWIDGKRHSLPEVAPWLGS